MVRALAGRRLKGHGSCVRYRTDSGAGAAEHLAGRAGESFPHATRIIGNAQGALVNRIVYLVGAVVIVFALLSFFGLR
jgi:hypothetical protein